MRGAYGKLLTDFSVRAVWLCAVGEVNERCNQAVQWIDQAAGKSKP